MPDFFPCFHEDNSFQHVYVSLEPLDVAIKSNDVALIMFLLQHPNIIINPSHVYTAIDHSDAFIINLLLKYPKNKEYFKSEDFVTFAYRKQKFNIARDLIE